MNDNIPLGAINKLTGQYVYPAIANKKDKYTCVDCNKDLILCHGEIRNPYFRHKTDSNHPCNHYNNPSENTIIKDAKILLKTLLDNKIPITLNRKCISCDLEEEYNIPEVSEGTLIKIDFELENNKKVDVSYLEEDSIVCIFEISNTVKNKKTCIIEPWFEINARDIINKANDASLLFLEFDCLRLEKCKNCKKTEDKLKKNKILASKKLIKWFNETKGIFPFRFRNYTGAFIESGERLLKNINNKICFSCDIVLTDKEYITYIIELKYDNNSNYYSKDIIKYCYENHYSLYTIDIDWILKQPNCPTKIVCKRVFDYNYDNIDKLLNRKKKSEMSILNDLDYNVYLAVDYSKKDLIKEIGGKWDDINKLWYIKKNIYKKRKDYINKEIGEEIEWINDI